MNAGTQKNQMVMSKAPANCLAKKKKIMQMRSPTIGGTRPCTSDIDRSRQGRNSPVSTSNQLKTGRWSGGRRDPGVINGPVASDTKTRQDARATFMSHVDDATSGRLKSFIVLIASSTQPTSSFQLDRGIRAFAQTLRLSGIMAPSLSALPVLTAIEDCGDYSKTVEPFLNQFYQLPGRLIASAGSIEALQRLYVETNPLITGFSASLFFAGLCFILSEINRNYSQIDRLWSILPDLHVVHLAVWARMTGLSPARIDLVAIFSTAWSVSDV